MCDLTQLLSGGVQYAQLNADEQACVITALLAASKSNSVRMMYALFHHTEGPRITFRDIDVITVREFVNMGIVNNIVLHACSNGRVDILRFLLCEDGPLREGLAQALENPDDLWVRNDIMLSALVGGDEDTLRFLVCDADGPHIPLRMHHVVESLLCEEGTSNHADTLALLFGDTSSSLHISWQYDTDHMYLIQTIMNNDLLYILEVLLTHTYIPQSDMIRLLHEMGDPPDRHKNSACYAALREHAKYPKSAHV